MEQNDRHLDSFCSSLMQYLNEVLIKKNCVSSTLRKHSVKNGNNIEFSVILKSPVDSSCDKKIFNQVESIRLTEQELKSLKKVSESLCLHIGNVVVRESKLYVKLNRVQVFSFITKTILDRKTQYGRNFSLNQTVRVTSDDVGATDLTEYRLKLLKDTIENILAAGGNNVSSTSGSEWLHVTTKNLKYEDSRSVILCGPVVNAVTKVKETEINFEACRRIYMMDLASLAEGKNTYDEHLLECLFDSSIKINLLKVKSTQAVSLNLSEDGGRLRETGSKGGVFLQYNVSRLSAIRRKYLHGVSQGIYPDIPRPEDVDFSVLKEPEEWALVFNFLLEYPSLINRIYENIMKRKIDVHLLCNFLEQLCSLFSAYYRRVRILLEPKDHLIPVIQGRLLLAMCVEQILENALTIFNIEKIEEM